MISAGMGGARKLTSYVSTEDEGGPKNFGDASLHPRAFQTELEEAYLFFFLAFFFAAILFSSRSSEFLASNAGGARIQSPCIRIARNLVKRKVIVRSRKLRNPPRDCGVIFPPPERRDPSRAGEARALTYPRDASRLPGRDLAVGANTEECI